MKAGEITFTVEGVNENRLEEGENELGYLVVRVENGLDYAIELDNILACLYDSSKLEVIKIEDIDRNLQNFLPAYSWEQQGGLDFTATPEIAYDLATTEQGDLKQYLDNESHNPIYSREAPSPSLPLLIEKKGAAILGLPFTPTDLAVGNYSVRLANQWHVKHDKQSIEASDKVIKVEAD